MPSISKFRKLMALVSLTIATVVIISWAIGQELLTRINPNFPVMQVTTAIAVILLSCSIFLRGSNQKNSRPLNFIGGALVFIGTFSIFVHFNQIPFLPVAISSLVPSVYSSLAFFFLGASTLFRNLNLSMAFTPTQILSLLALGITYTSTVGFLYQTVFFYRIVGSDTTVGISVATALSIGALSFAQLFDRPVGVASLLLSPYQGGRLLRKMVVAIWIIPPLIGSTLMYGSTLFRLDPATLAIQTLFIVSSFLFVSWKISVRLEATDKALHQELFNIETMSMIASTANEALSLKVAIERTLNQICDRTDWDLAHIFLLHSIGRLEPLRIWPSVKGADFEMFYKQTETLNLGDLSIILKKTISNKKSIFLSDISRNKDFLRADAAAKAGLKSAVFTPIIVHGQALGVLEVYSKNQIEVSQRHLSLLSSAANNLWHSIERAKFEQNLRDSEEKFRLLVEGVKDYAIFMLDPNGYITSWNDGARNLKGYGAHEILGKHFSVFYSENEVLSNKPALVLKIAEERGRYEDIGWRKKKDGSFFWADVLVTAIRGPDNKLLINA